VIGAAAIRAAITSVHPGGPSMITKDPVVISGAIFRDHRLSRCLAGELTDQTSPKSDAEPMTRPGPREACGAAGAAASAVTALVWAFLHSGPSHYEWTDAWLVLGALGLFLGGAVGAVVGDFRPRD
jgi:hypothetical protein